jgi:hypothetical protein
MIRFIISVFLFSFSVIMSAGNVGEMFVAMPDSVIPYINKELRQDLVNMKNIDPETNASLATMFKSKIVLKNISDNMLTFDIGSVGFEMARLKSNDNGDSIYCLLRTVATPEKETYIYLYDKDWKLLRQLDYGDMDFLKKPDTMQVDEYQELTSMAEFTLIEAHFGEQPEVLELICDFPMLTADEKKRIKAFGLQRKLKWDGESFK